MRSNAIAFPFAILAASAFGWHGCQPTTAGGAKPTLASTPVASSSSGLTVLYQNNGNGEIEPCG